MFGFRRDLRRVDHIDLPTTRAFWQILSDDRGRAFSWINYAPMPAVDGGRPDTFRLEGPCEILGDNGWLLSREGWYACCSWRSGQSYLPRPLRVPAPSYDRHYKRMVRLPGITLSALNDNPNAYGHLLMDGLYKLLKGIEVMGGAERLDQIIVHPAMERLLPRSILGDDAVLNSKLLPSDPHAIYWADALIAVTSPACCMNVSRAQLDLVRTARRRDRAGVGDRIFLARTPGHRRGIKNLDGVARIFGDHGYLIVTGADLDDSWAAFADADIVAGIHGSDLADCVFMRPGSTLFEIVPSDHRKPYYFNVAAKLGIDFRCLLAESATRRPTVHGPSYADVTVDVAALDAVLNAIDEGAPSKSHFQQQLPI